jgi:hypothetical protein
MIGKLILWGLNDFEDLCKGGNFFEGGFVMIRQLTDARQKQIFSCSLRWTASIATHIWYLTASYFEKV